MAEIGHNVVQQTTAATRVGTWQTGTGMEILGSNLDASSDYLLVFFALVGGNSANANDFEFRVVEEDGTPTVLTASEHRLEPRRTGSTLVGHAYAYMARVTTAATPNDYAMQLQTAGVNTAHIAGMNAFAIKLDDVTENTDFFYDDDATSYTTLASSTYQDGAAVTIGDGTSDYLVISTAHFVVDAVAPEALLRIDVGGVVHGATITETEDTAEEYCIGTLAFVSAPSASTTVTTQVSNSGSSGDIDVDNNRIFALRLDAFEDHAGTRDTTPTNITIAATDTVSGTLAHTTVTAASEDWMFVALGVCDMGDNAKRIAPRIDDTTIGNIAGTSGISYSPNGGVDEIGMLLAGELAAVANSTGLDIDFIAREAADVSPNPVVDETTIVAWTWELVAGGESILSPASESTVSVATEAPDLLRTIVQALVSEATIAIATEAPALLVFKPVSPAAEATISVATEAPTLEPIALVQPDTSTILIGTDAPTIAKIPTETNVVPISEATISISTQAPDLALEGVVVELRRSDLGGGGRNYDHLERLAKDDEEVLKLIQTFLEAI